MQRKVLVIDDTKNIRMLLTKCLELEGCKVTGASNGREGLDCIRKEAYDLIFLDIKLPEMSGTEVLRQMRADNVQTPVIAITAYPTIKNAVECTRLGVVSYLQKPFTAERLKNVLNELTQSNVLACGDPFASAESAMQAGDPIYALSILGGALGADPQNPKAYSMIAKAYDLIGDKDSAEKFYRAAKLFE